MNLQHPNLKPGARIAVGMSGGVDSCMTAWLLQRAGYDVVGLTMAIWDNTIQLPDEGRPGCFGPGEAQDIADARAFAARLGIPHHVVRMEEEYRQTVLEYFRREYVAGRTPNPCVRCNREMKFGFLIERARALGIEFDFFATGHYARVAWDEARGRWLLLRARDRTKDQSYFISQLRQDQLAGLLLPLGELTKEEVKAQACEAGFPELAEKQESQDFLEAKDYSVLFKEGDARPGPIIDQAGHLLGTHKGIIHYTVGQRKGLGIGGTGEPLYVTGVDAATDTVKVGHREDLFAASFRATHCNWIAWAGAPAEPARVECRIRIRHAGAPAVILRDADAATVRVAFDEPQMSITPGQTAVFYDGDVVVGAGTIEVR